MIRLLFLVFLFFSMIDLNAQQSVNDYKYIIVPDGYSAFKGDDAYQLNSLTKFLFKKYGFLVISQNKKLPDDLIKNGCKGLRVEVKKNSSLFITKLIVELKNCNGLVLFTSSEGQSREKEYRKAFQEALREAFKSILNLNYEYNEKSGEGLVSSKESKNVSFINNGKEKKSSVAINKHKEAIPIEKNSNYVFEGIKYSLKKNKYGYDVFKYYNESSKQIGKIYKASRENDYFIKGHDNINGLGYFDNQGNFTLERINYETNELMKEVFVKQ